jgi:hypothetical protein
MHFDDVDPESGVIGWMFPTSAWETPKTNARGQLVWVRVQLTDIIEGPPSTAKDSLVRPKCGLFVVSKTPTEQTLFRACRA